MVLEVRLMGENCDAGTTDRLQKEYRYKKGKTFDERVREILDEVVSSGKDPSKWVIVTRGSDKSIFYLKYCKDEDKKKLRPQETRKSRVYYIIDVPDHHIQPLIPQVEVVNDYNIIRGAPPFIRHRY